MNALQLLDMLELISKSSHYDRFTRCFFGHRRGRCAADFFLTASRQVFIDVCYWLGLAHSRRRCSRRLQAMVAMGGKDGEEKRMGERMQPIILPIEAGFQIGVQ